MTTASFDGFTLAAAGECSQGYRTYHGRQEKFSSRFILWRDRGQSAAIFSLVSLQLPWLELHLTSSAYLVSKFLSVRGSLLSVSVPGSGTSNCSQTTSQEFHAPVWKGLERPEWVKPSGGLGYVHMCVSCVSAGSAGQLQWGCSLRGPCVQVTPAEDTGI